MALTVVAAYDISNDGRRSKVAAILQTAGYRIQKSVYVLTLGHDELDAMRARVHGVIDVDVDSVYFFRQCAACWESLICLGQASPPQPVRYWFV